MVYAKEMNRCFANDKIQKPKKNYPKKAVEEKRAKCRTWAKCRRQVESNLFDELSTMLPKSDQEHVYQIDRLAVLRLATATCRANLLAKKFLTSNVNGNQITSDKKFDICLDSCIEGFIMVVNSVGQLRYVTESVADILGFTQIDLSGRYLLDYVHDDDWNDLRNRLTKNNLSEDESKTVFRIKTALSPRGGRAKKLTLAVYKPLNAFIVKPCRQTFGSTFDEFGKSNSTTDLNEDLRFIHCIPFSLPSNFRSSSTTIISRHELGMRFRYCDQELMDALEYKDLKSFLARSYFNLIHPDDIKNVTANIKETYQKGYSQTGYYRLLNRSNNSIWIMTEMHLLVQNLRGGTSKSIVCLHKILGEADNITAARPMKFDQIDRNQLSENIDEVLDCVFETSNTQEEVERSNSKQFNQPLTETTPMWEDSKMLAPFIQRDFQISMPTPTNDYVNTGRSRIVPNDMTTPKVMDETIEVDKQYAPNTLNATDASTEYTATAVEFCEHSKSLAPFISCDIQTLIPLEDDDDDDMPGLLPLEFECQPNGNNVNIDQNGQTKRNKTTADMPLDFGDFLIQNDDAINYFSKMDMEVDYDREPAGRLETPRTSFKDINQSKTSNEYSEILAPPVNYSNSSRAQIPYDTAVSTAMDQTIAVDKRHAPNMIDTTVANSRDTFVHTEYTATALEEYDHSKVLAPFISCDIQTLTPLDDDDNDDDMPGLLPLEFETQPNPGNFNIDQRGQTKGDKMKSTNPFVIGAVDMPLDFGDFLIQNDDAINYFSKMDMQMDYDNQPAGRLETPRTSSVVEPKSESTTSSVVVNETPKSNNALINEPVSERQRQMDSKTVQFFEVMINYNLL